jgi:hypothetical protein
MSFFKKEKRDCLVAGYVLLCMLGLMLPHQARYSLAKSQHHRNFYQEYCFALHIPYHSRLQDFSDRICQRK